MGGIPKVSQEEWVRRYAKAGLELLEEVRNQSHKAKCRCLKCSAICEPIPKNIAKGQGGCLACAGQAPVSQEVWKERYAAVGLELLEEVRGRRHKAKCRCLKCGMICEPLSNNIGGQGGCRACANKAKAEAHKLDQSVWKERYVAAGLELLGSIEGNRHKAKCRCLKCGAECYPIPNNIQKGCGGCQNCAESGYNTSKPGYFYVFLLEDDGEIFTGFGITNVPEARLSKHANNFDLYGIKVLRRELLGPFDGGDVARLERQFKKQVNKLETLVCDGFHTESFLGDCFDEVVWEARDQLENR